MLAVFAFWAGPVYSFYRMTMDRRYIMNEAMENLLTRRSIRKYEARQISDEQLQAVLEAGSYAPTARGTQSPLMIAVQNREDRDELSRINARIWGREGFDPFYGAPTVVLVFAEAGNPNGVQDASLVLGNLMNAAHAEGLGSCWINRIRETFELPEGKALLKKWGVEGEWTGVGSCILGYAEGPAPVPAARKSGYYRVIK